MRKFVAIGLLLAGCATTSDKAYRLLNIAGYTDIKVEGFSLFTCSGSEVGRSFHAKNTVGRDIHGVVCCSWSQPCAILFQ